MKLKDSTHFLDSTHFPICSFSNNGFNRDRISIILKSDFIHWKNKTKMHYYSKGVLRWVVDGGDLDISRGKHNSVFQAKAKELIFNWIIGFVAEIEGWATDMICLPFSKMSDSLAHEMLITHLF